MNQNDKIKEAYEAVSGSGLFVDEQDFREMLKQDPKGVFDLFKSNENTRDLFVDQDDFETILGLKGASSEGTPAPSGTSQRGQIQPFRGGLASQNKQPERPQVSRGVAERKKQEVETANQNQEGLPDLAPIGKPQNIGDITGTYQQGDVPTMEETKKAELPMAQKEVEYKNNLQKAAPFLGKEGFRQTSQTIAFGEGTELEKFSPIIDDYIASIEDESTRNYEADKWNFVKEQYTKSGSLTEIDKKELTKLAENALSGYAAARQARLYELDRDYNVNGYFNAVSGANAQITGIQRQIKAINEDTSIGQQEKQRRLLELQATAERIGARVQSFQIPPEVLEEAENLYQDLRQIQNIYAYSGKVLGGEERKVKAELNMANRGERGAMAQFTDATLLSLNKGMLSVFQLPKTLTDAVGLGDDTFTAVDNLYMGVQNYKDELQNTFGREVNFDELPMYAKIPTYLGEGIGSVLTFAGGAKILGSGASKLSQGLGVAASAFLTTESEYYQEAIDAGMTAKEAGRVAASIAAVTSSIEAILPDTEFFNATTVGRSVIRAMSSGKTFGEALQLGLKEIPASTMEYLQRSGADFLKEEGEEAVGAVGEGLVKQGVNAAMGGEYYAPMTTGDVTEQAFMGGLTGGALGGVRRMTSSRRSPVQESFVGEVSRIPETALEVLTSDEDVDFVKRAVERRRVYESMPAFRKLPVNVQDHIISEATRADQLKEAAKKSGLEEDVTAKEVAEANANILYALNNGKIKGEKEAPSPTMEWEGEDVKPKTNDSKNEQGVPSEVGEGQALVQAEPIQGGGASEVSPSGVVQAPQEIAPQPPTEEQKVEDLKNKRFVTFEYNDESEVPSVLKDKISSVSEINGKKTVRVTLLQSEADYILATQQAQEEIPALTAEEETAMPAFEVKTEEVKAVFPELDEPTTELVAAVAESQEIPVEEAKAIVDERTPSEGDEVVLPPVKVGEKTYGGERTMVFKDGVWQQKVGGVTSQVSPAVQGEAKAEFSQAATESAQAPAIERPKTTDFNVERDNFIKDLKEKNKGAKIIVRTDKTGDVVVSFEYHDGAKNSTQSKRSVPVYFPSYESNPAYYEEPTGRSKNKPTQFELDKREIEEGIMQMGKKTPEQIITQSQLPTEVAPVVEAAPVVEVQETPVEAAPVEVVEEVPASETVEVTPEAPAPVTETLEAAPVVETKAENPALKDVESTAKALEDGIDNAKIRKSDLRFIAEQFDEVKNPEINGFNKSIGEGWKSATKEQIEALQLGYWKNVNTEKAIAEAYHKAKADGSNSELVAAVEELLATKETTEQTPQAKPEILAAIDDEIETTDKRQIAAKRKQNKAKFGDLYTKAVRVTKDFQNIINTLEQQGKITKKCP